MAVYRAMGRGRAVLNLSSIEDDILLKGMSISLPASRSRPCSLTMVMDPSVNRFGTHCQSEIVK